jgi:nucleoside-diphosphate-sugar epimerase
MRIFITGIAGFLGSHLAEYLKNQGHDVWGMDSLMMPSIRLKHVGSHLFEGSLMDQIVADHAEAAE